MTDPKFYKNYSVKNHLCTSGIVVRNGKVLLGNRIYHDASYWVSPGGRCDENEKPELAVIREVTEEIGVTDAKIVSRLGEKDGAYSDESGRDKVIVFKIATNQEPRLMEPEKFKEWRWFGLNELPDNLPTPQDKDFFKKAIKKSGKDATTHFS